MKLCLTISILLITVSLVNQGEVVKIDIPKDYEYKVEEVITYPLYDSGIIVDYVRICTLGRAKIVDKYYDIVKALLEAACKDGVTIKINSGYRTFQDQLEIRRRYVLNKKCRDDIDYLINAESTEFDPETGRPGHSRHHSGIAYDFNTKDPEVYKWLQAKAIHHGFVRTIEDERWHWEYLNHICDRYEYVPKHHWSWRISKKVNRR